MSERTCVHKHTKTHSLIFCCNPSPLSRLCYLSIQKPIRSVVYTGKTKYGTLIIIKFMLMRVLFSNIFIIILTQTFFFRFLLPECVHYLSVLLAVACLLIKWSENIWSARALFRFLCRVSTDI